MKTWTNCVTNVSTKESMQHAFEIVITGLKRRLVLVVAWLILSGLALAQVDLPPEMRADVLLNQANENIKAKKWGEAAKAFEAVAQLDLALPDSFHFQYGRTLLEAGKESQGVRELTDYLVKAGKAAPRYGEAVSNLCVHVSAGSLDTSLSGALRLKVVQDFLGQDVRSQNWGRAVADYDELARLGDLPPEAQYQRAVVAEKAGQCKAATAVLTGYLKLGREQAHYQEAIALFFKVRLQEKEQQARNRKFGDAAGATKEKPWANSLGMRFVPVPGTEVMFSIWDTRVQDYQAYAEANSGVDGSWKKGSLGEEAVSDGPTHPVTMVSWDDAKAFCAWLSHKEGKTYRLPTDAEWIVAVGLENESGNTPSDKNSKIQGVYPWGTSWPPPVGAGNYADSTAKGRFTTWEVVEGYNDGYATTSPVGSFAANRYGLYDMGGNVRQWCEDWSDGRQRCRVLRGASWMWHGPDNLLSSYRDYRRPVARLLDVGFRCVLVDSTSR